MKIRTGTSCRTCVAMGRILSLLMLVLLVIMPLTEHFWHFDGFMSGGQDFEFGLLAALIFFGLVLVLLHHGKQAICLLMAVRLWQSFVFRKANRRGRIKIEPSNSCHAISLLGPARRSYTLPIQV